MLECQNANLTWKSTMLIHLFYMFFNRSSAYTKTTQRGQTKTELRKAQKPSKFNPY